MRIVVVVEGQVVRHVDADPAWVEGYRAGRSDAAASNACSIFTHPNEVEIEDEELRDEVLGYL